MIWRLDFRAMFTSEDQDARHRTGLHTVIRFVWVGAKFGTCTVESVNGALVPYKMCIFTLESAYFIFNKCATTVQVPNLALTHTKRFTVQGHQNTNKYVFEPAPDLIFSRNTKVFVIRNESFHDVPKKSKTVLPDPDQKYDWVFVSTFRGQGKSWINIIGLY